MSILFAASVIFWYPTVLDDVTSAIDNRTPAAYHVDVIFIETSIFTRRIQECMDDSSYADLQGFLANNPEAGSVIPGSGGIRKIRWTGSGRGKRGGSRILYYLWTEERILMLFAYLKNEMEDLSQPQLKQLRTVVEENLK